MQTLKNGVVLNIFSWTSYFLSVWASWWVTGLCDGTCTQAQSIRRSNTSVISWIAVYKTAATYCQTHGHVYDR